MVEYTAIRIDEEFQDLIPPLSEEEYNGLRDSILQEGCRDALIVWGDLLIDGHNRYKICKEHNLPFKTVQKDFDSRNDAIIWIIMNKLGRQNLSTYDRARLALILKPIISGKANDGQKHVRQRHVMSQIENILFGASMEERIASIRGAGFSYDVERNLIELEKMQAAKKRRNKATAEKTYIYFMRIDDKMKVGSSSDVASRLQQLRVSAPTITLLASILFGEGARKHENALKRKFSDYLISGEVYTYSDALLSNMLEYTEQAVNGK